MKKIVAISDQHGNLPTIQNCDLLLIAGDIVPIAVQNNPFDSMKWLNGPFGDWLNSVPAKHVVGTPGNHDFIFQRAFDMVPKSLRWHLLIDNLAEVEGLKIWGSPWQNWFYDWAFNAPPDEEGGQEFLARKYRAMPDDTDIIVSHGPPRGYGDQIDLRGDRLGSQALTDRIMEVKPKLVVCGHIHTSRGQWTFPRGNAADGIIANVAILNDEYKMVYEPMVFEIEDRLDVAYIEPPFALSTENMGKLVERTQSDPVDRED